MERDKQIQIALSRLAKPWTSIGETPPPFSVLEVVRATGVRNNEVDTNTSPTITSINKQRIVINAGEDKKLVAVINDTPETREQYKRSVALSGYRSREPGSQKVIKRRILGEDLKKKILAISKRRMRVLLEPATENDKSQSRTGNRKTDSKKQTDKTELEVDALWESVLSMSVVPPERPSRIKELLGDVVSGKGSACIVNWICPPGSPLQLDASSGALYRRFTQIDPAQGFINDYRLYPRLDLERQLVSLIGRKYPTLNYFKIIADDNPYCIYPKSLQVDGTDKTLGAISNYGKYVQSQLDTLVGSGAIWLMNWSEMLGPKLFEEFLETFRQTRIEDLLPFLPPNIIEIEIDVVTKHTNLGKELLPYVRNFVKGIIRQYAVEGYFLYELFGDNVILAWNESTRRSNIIDSLRKLRGVPPLPKIYVLYNKRGGKIENNF